MWTFWYAIFIGSNIPARPTNPPILIPVESNTAGQFKFDTGTQSQSEMIGSADETQLSMHTSFIVKAENASATFFQLVYLI